MRGRATERLRQDYEKRKNKAWFGEGQQSWSTVQWCWEAPGPLSGGAMWCR